MANKNGNSSISPLHLLLSILTAPDSLVKEILLEAGVDIQLLAGNVRKAVDALPKVS
jgi:ATP-dependent Clp protease ATP-binding subunit ClpA